MCLFTAATGVQWQLDPEAGTLPRRRDQPETTAEVLDDLAADRQPQPRSSGPVVLVAGHLLFVGIRMLRTPGLVFWGSVLLVLLATQVTLGISNIVAGLPLWVAVAHNAGAALLLFTVVGLLARLRAPE